MAGDRYQTFRSVSDVHVSVLCRDGTFYERVPEEVRKQGPWQGQHRGEVEPQKEVRTQRSTVRIARSGLSSGAVHSSESSRTQIFCQLSFVM
jgi:hypothetical protein